MGRVYSISHQWTHSGPTYAIYMTAVAPLSWIHEVRLDQYSEAGELEQEMLRVNLSLAITPPASAALATAKQLDRGDTAPQNTFNQSEVSGAADDAFLQMAWNIQAGFLYLPTPEDRIIITASDSDVFCVNLPGVTPTDPISMTVNLVWEEAG